MYEVTFISIGVIVVLAIMSVCAFFLCTKKIGCCHHKSRSRSPHISDNSAETPDVAVMTDDAGNMFVIGGIHDGQPHSLNWKPPEYEDVANLPSYDEAIKSYIADQKDHRKSTKKVGDIRSTSPSVSVNILTPSEMQQQRSIAAVHSSIIAATAVESAAPTVTAVESAARSAQEECDSPGVVNAGFTSCEEDTSDITDSQTYKHEDIHLDTNIRRQDSNCSTRNIDCDTTDPAMDTGGTNTN